jgi:hypothetical protein
MTLWQSKPQLTATTPAPRTGTHCMGLSSGTRFLYTSSPTLVVGFAFYMTTEAGYLRVYTDNGFSYLDAQWSVALQADRKISFWRGDSDTLGTLIDTTASPVIVASSWNFIEVKVLCSDTGTYTVKCNGVTVLNGSADTQNEPTPSLTGLAVSAPSGTGIDDLYVLDGTGTANNDFLGDCKVECLIPQIGNGAHIGLTCSTGSDHGALVDERPANDDTDYNFGTTPGVKDTYTFTDVTTVGTIKAVQVSARAKKTDTATKELAIVTRIGGVDAPDGATQAVAATTYGQYQQIWEKRPTDNGDWTITDINGAEFGVKIVT